MSADGESRSSDARSRAARTKRDRTRRALLEAADAAFATRGWNRTRIEDVAATAEVSTATAYNHFASKHVLIGHVYARLVTPLLEQAQADRAAGQPIVEALKDQVKALTRTSWRNRGLTTTFWFGVQDYMATRTGGPPDPLDRDDPRTIAPIPDALVGLIEEGQASGELRPYPPATEIGGAVINLLLIRAVNRPHEPPEQTAELLLSVMLGVLKPELLASTPSDERPFLGGR